MIPTDQPAGEALPSWEARALAARERALTERETACAKRERTVARREAAAVERTAALRREAAELRRREIALAQERRRLGLGIEPPALPPLMTLRPGRPAPVPAPPTGAASASSGDGLRLVIAGEVMPQFLAERVASDPSGTVTAAEVWDAYGEWSRARGLAPCSQTALGRALRRAGYTPTRGHVVRWAGLRLV